MKILNKVLFLMLALTLIPLVILGTFSINDIDDMRDIAENNVKLIGKTAIDDNTVLLNNLGKNIIKQKAIDVAKQIEIYIKDNPELTITDLQNTEYFKSLAVQPVGQTGYTAVTDVDTLICRFHASEKVVNLDLHKLAEKLPGFWGVMFETKGGKVAQGYYDWAETDGSIKQKYMYIAIVDAISADGVTLSVAATTYIEEFSAPVYSTKLKLDNTINTITNSIESIGNKIKFQTTIFIILTMIIVFVVGFLFANTITNPIKKLTAAGNKIADGNLDTELPQIKSKDEINQLANTMNLLVGALKFLKKDKEAKTAKKKK